MYFVLLSLENNHYQVFKKTSIVFWKLLHVYYINMFFSTMYKCTWRHMINRPTLYFWYCRPMAMIHEINFIIIIYYMILKPLKVFFRRKNIHSNHYVHCCIIGCYGYSLIVALGLNKNVSCEGPLKERYKVFWNIYISIIMQSLIVKFHI